MKTILLEETGYNHAVLGFSLSYNSSIERTKNILPRYAFGKSGENKFLESIQLWIDIDAPRFWWQEFDTYRSGISKQSASSMHTLMKSKITQENFEYPIDVCLLNILNDIIDTYKGSENKKDLFLRIKNILPEGFLQRRIVSMNYKVFRHMYEQRIDHKLPQWQYFCNTLLDKIEHPEFIVLDLVKVV